MVRVWLCTVCVLFSLVGIGPTTTVACLIDPCLSSASNVSGVLLVCPAGDAPTLSSIGATVSVTVLGCSSEPVPGIPAEEFWIHPHSGSLTLCDYYLSSNADAGSDVNGATTISGSIAAGGYSPDVHVVAQAMMIGAGCSSDAPLTLVLVSPDINGDLIVNLVDLSTLAEAFLGGGGSADPRLDFNGDGQIDVMDVSLFAEHYQHRCE